MAQTPPQPTLAAPVRTYYDNAPEAQRLATGAGQLERVRTQEIIERFLPPAPRVVLALAWATIRGTGSMR